MAIRNVTRQAFGHVVACMNRGLADPATYCTYRVAFGEVRNTFAS